MGFSAFYLTTQGSALLAKAQASQAITLTRAEIGRGFVPEGKNIIDTTALYDTNPIPVVLRGCTVSGQQATIGVQIVNTTFSATVPFREIGIFANDPEEGEILYAYGNAGNDADSIPDKNIPTEFLFNLICKIGSVKDIHITVDKGIIYITTSDLEIGLATREESLHMAPSKDALTDTDTIPLSDMEDGGKTKKIAWGKIKDALVGALQYASQAEAEAGVSNNKVMSPLRTFQAMAKWVLTSNVLQYGQTQGMAGLWDKIITAPTATNPIRYNGYFRATRVYGGYYSDSADYAEAYETQPCKAGDLLMVDGQGQIRRNSLDANPAVLGFVSDDFATLIGVSEIHKTPIALCGRVAVNVVGRVVAGEYLVGSSVLGAARAAKGNEPRGAIVGMALESKATEVADKVLTFILRM